MYMVGVTGFFSAIHSLAGDVPEHEKLPHAHEYKLEWTLEVGKLDERGFSLDISVLEGIREEMFKSLEGKNLNENPYFLNKPVSLENLCDFIYAQLLSELSKRISQKDRARTSSMEVRIWENEQAWAGIKRTL